MNVVNVIKALFRCLGICLVTCIAAIGSLENASAQFGCRINTCKSDVGPQDFTPSVCRGRRMPQDKIRWKANHRLECTSNVDNYIRRPQPFDFISWEGKRASVGEASSSETCATIPEDHKVGARWEMYRQRRQEQPDIKWAGQIPYATVEKWNWEECSYGQDSSCGTYKCNCHQESTTDSKGRKTGSREVCSTCTCSCYHDETRSESWHCSDELMKFNAQYVRPTEKEWCPQDPNYYDIIPNKYDLLPAEVEVASLYTNASSSSTLAPNVQFGDAWNEYRWKVRFDEGSSSVQCRHDVNHHIQVDVFTEKRLIKKTPNAFSLPLDENKKEISEPFAWVEAIGTDNERVQKAYPDSLRLVDTASAMISAMSAQTREFNALRESEKLKAGALANVSQEESVEQMKRSGFFKNTNVRIQLYLERWGRDRSVIRKNYTTDVKAAQPNPNLYFEFNSLEDLSDIYDIRIDYTPSSLISRDFWEGFQFRLQPGRHYYFYVSMFQKGVPFYTQSCEDRGAFFCSEESFYSKPMMLNFDSDKNYDQRGWWRKLNDFLGG